LKARRSLPLGMTGMDPAQERHRAERNEPARLDLRLDPHEHCRNSREHCEGCEGCEDATVERVTREPAYPCVRDHLGLERSLPTRALLGGSCREGLSGYDSIARPPCEKLEHRRSYDVIFSSFSERSRT
jgi:hypothetical protein